jgi:RNA polymerase sigma-70 factor (ECF subfamily)
MNEIHIIEKAIKGDKDCFSRLIKLHQNRLYKYLLLRCHSIHDAEDIMQDTFINAYKYIHSYKPKWEFSTWIFTIANRLLKKQHDMYYQNKEISMNTQIAELEKCSIDQTNIWIHIKYIIKSDAYDVLWFYYVEEASIKEISKILQKSISWVKMTMYRSKKKLAVSNKLKILSKDYLMIGIKL